MLPVKAWVYGGKMEVGSISDPLYNGCFSAEDAIVVSINYRLGPHGYLALPDAGIYGNYGVQDILLGLRWIQDNIADFGGDPQKVLLFGQSAGAANSYVISSLPQAPSLIAGAAILSGGGRNIAALDDVKAWNEEFATRLNCSTSDAACLRAVSPDSMNRTMAAMSTYIHSPGAQSLAEYHGKGARWAPVVDGILVPKQPGGIGSKVPAIVSSVAQDGRMFTIGSYGDRLASVNDTDYYNFLTTDFGPMADYIYDARPVDDVGPLTVEQKALNASNAFWAITNAVTHYKYMCPTHRGLEVTSSNGIDVYAYYFNHTPSCNWLGGSSSKMLGPTHASDLPFVFAITENLPPGIGSCNLSSAEQDISDFYVKAFNQMAATGKPATTSEWPTWTKSAGRGLIVTDKIEVGIIDYSECEFWDYVESELAAMAANGTLFNTSISDNSTSSPGVTTTNSATQAVAANTLSILSLTSAMSMMLCLFI